MWVAEENGVRMFFFSDKHEKADEINQKVYADPRADKVPTMEPRTPLFHTELWEWGERLGSRAFSEMALASMKSYSMADDPETAIPQTVRDANLMEQFMLGLWEFMQEKLPSLAHPDRAAWKRLVRSGHPWNEVKVIELRAVETNPVRSEDPQDVMWTHRWKVRSHIRRWVDKDGNERQTTVSAHIKGPENLPLIEKDSVFNVRR
jgi:hypothetical protein